jgi:UTP--glucose-1-phosphate uridylyltransferase
MPWQLAIGTASPLWQLQPQKPLDFFAPDAIVCQRASCTSCYQSFCSAILNDNQVVNTTHTTNYLPVKKAVFPIAGLGTRFLPVTKATPKEMLPVVDKPLIQYAVEEAYAAGVREMIFVTGRTKRAVEDHFDTAYELETELERVGKHKLLELARSIAPSDMTCVYVRQNRALGLGHAVLCARPLVGDEPFAVVLADDFMVSAQPVLSQLMVHQQQHGCSVIAVNDVQTHEVSQYGIVSGQQLNDHTLAVQKMVEKPAVGSIDSTTAIVGRYLLTPAIFDCLVQVAEKTTTGEIQLTDAIRLLLAQEAVHALRYTGNRYDCGSKLGMLQATVDMALQHPDVKDNFAAWLNSKSLTP